jgi:hypothetical protein
MNEYQSGDGQDLERPDDIGPGAVPLNLRSPLIGMPIH